MESSKSPPPGLPTPRQTPSPGPAPKASQTPTKPSPLTTRRRSRSARLFSLIFRLFTWYAIITVLFRCPSTLEECNESSPRLCRPYFQTKHFVAPHVKPLYDSYASPYVEAARPYYETVDRYVLSNAKLYGVRYGGPAVESLREVGARQWEANVHPRLINLQNAAELQYQTHLAPHIERTATVIYPWYRLACARGQQLYHDVVLPAYRLTQPHIVSAYHTADDFASTRLVPIANRTSAHVYHFVDTIVWPHVKALYVQNVEPQLARIGKRLGQHQGRQSLQTAKTSLSGKGSFTSVEAPDSSLFMKPTAPAYPILTGSPSVSTSVEPAAEAPRASEVPKRDEEADTRQAAQDTVAKDLKEWQDRFVKAAEESAAEIENRIDEIAAAMRASQLMKAGQVSLEELEDHVRTSMVKLRQRIVEIVEEHPEPGRAADEAVLVAIRGVGKSVKSKAEAVRDWRETFEDTLKISVTQAVDEHFKTLATIRDLAMQKIGMKWAWMDGVTYKDWAKYHDLKRNLDTWTNDLKTLIVTNPNLMKTQEAAAMIEEKTLDVARDVAHDLVQLKQIAGWKIAARDASDNFDFSSLQAAAEAVQQKRGDGASAESASVTEFEAPHASADMGSKKSAEPEDTSSSSSVDTSSTVPCNSEIPSAEPKVPLSPFVLVDSLHDAQDTASTPFPLLVGDFD